MELFEQPARQQAHLAPVNPVQRQIVGVAEPLGDLRGDFSLAGLVLVPARLLAADRLANLGLVQIEGGPRLFEAPADVGVAAGLRRFNFAGSSHGGQIFRVKIASVYCRFART